MSERGPKRTGLSIKCPHCDGSGRMAMERLNVGDLIHAQRKARGMTQDELCQKVLLSRAQIANIEGGRSDIPLKTLARFADALGCTMKDLVP